MNNTINKGYGLGDRAYKIIHHLESMAVVLLGSHIIVEQQAVGVPSEMAEFYEVFCVHDEGTLLPTTMPVGIFNMAFRFDHNLSTLVL